jgi:phosphoribosylanthranilate isomerase
MMTRVKICGITQLSDAQTAIEAGASALGFVFYKPSPRYVEPSVAQHIIKQLPPFVTVTALVVNHDAQYVNSIIEQVKPDLLQFHGNEDNDFCTQFDRPFIKALRMKEGEDIAALCQQYPDARAILLDSYVKGLPGGTGAAFNWQLIPEELRSSIILAGGLDADNVASAIAQVGPFALDVSGGVEREKGVKCAQKIKCFMQAVHTQDFLV